MQRQDGIVAQSVFKRVTAHVTALVLQRTEGPESVVLRLVDGRSREAEEEGVGQGGAHTLTEVTLLRAVRLVHHHDDVVAAVDVGLGVLELEDGGDDDIACVVLQKLVQCVDVLGGHYVGRLLEDVLRLRVQVYAINHNHHRGAFQLGHTAHLLCGKEH